MNPLTPTEVARKIAEMTGTSLEQAKAFLTAQAKLAHENAEDGVPIPGIGVLVVQQTAAREVPMRFGPRAGETVVVPAKKILKFRLSKRIKDAVMGSSKELPDLFADELLPALQFVTDGQWLSDPSQFLPFLKSTLRSTHDRSNLPIKAYQLPDLELASGRLLACDGMMFGLADRAFSMEVSPGRYPIALMIASFDEDERVALAAMRFSNAPVIRWELAMPEGFEPDEDSDEGYAFGVDSGTGCICDASFPKLANEFDDAGIDLSYSASSAMDKTTRDTWSWTEIVTAKSSAAIFSSGKGDGSYASYFGIDASGKPSAFVTDFGLVSWK